MKVLKKVGLFFTSIAVEFKVLVSRVYAMSIENIDIQSVYGVVVEPETSIITNIISTIIIPVTLLIGLIVFLVKSTSSIAKKVIISVGVVIAYIIFRIIMNLI